MKTGMHLRYDADELGRLDNLLKHATMGLQFVTQAIEGLREVIGTGVLYNDERTGRHRAKRVVSAKGALSWREARNRPPVEASPRKKRQRPRQRRPKSS
jgi:hypothetical protein